MNVDIHPSWKEALQEEFEKDYFKELTEFVKKEYKNKKVYPPPKQIFSAFDNCPFNEVKVVIIGQDPYHGPKQANGMCFAVHEAVKNPPSLRNIFKEITNDIGKEPKHSDLTHWAKQGALLLNATLTVRSGDAGSHQGQGWEKFTDAAIKKLSDEKENLVFLLWGNFAKSKAELIDNNKHLILEATHPSPFSAHKGFFGCNHFSKTNKFLKMNDKEPINWIKDSNN